MKREKERDAKLCQEVDGLQNFLGAPNLTRGEQGKLDARICLNTSIHLEYQPLGGMSSFDRRTG